MDVLPPELIRECLLRVPYTSHPNLAAVCRSWRAVVKSPEFYEDRKKFGISQHCICLFGYRQYHGDHIEEVITVYDPVQGTWEQLPPIPHFPGRFKTMLSLCRCLRVNRKLVFIYGQNPKGVQHTVFIYDFSCGKWSLGRDIPLQAATTAFSVSPEGLIYVAGGLKFGWNTAREAAVYNVEKDEWKLLPPMNQPRAYCIGAFIDRKFFVFGGFSNMYGGDLEMDAEVYDPEKGTWATLVNMWTDRNGEINVPKEYAAASFNGVLYWFQEEDGAVKLYDSRENVWRAVGYLPQTFGKITCCTAWRDRIFLSAYLHGKSRLYVDGKARDNVFYMWKPPRIGCGAELSQEEVAGEWSVIPIKRPQHSPMDYDEIILSVVTLEI